MKKPFVAACVAVAVSIGLGPELGVQAQAAAPIKASEVPRRKKAAPLPPRGTYKPPKTSWGDPAIAGAYNNSDESGIPFERPPEFAGRTLESFTPEELAKITQQRQEQTIERNPTLSEFPGATSPMHWFENSFAANSRAWLVADPPDGRVPPLTDEAKQRAAASQEARKGRGPADSYVDRSLYDRCITRGVPGSMMPAIYGNSYRIVQGQGWVAITYEMVHETRVIPLDNRAHVGKAILLDMGDARGHWEGDTLVVESTNFHPLTVYRGATPSQLKLTERFKRVAQDKVAWSVTMDDPSTWTAPWTIAMPLSWEKQPSLPFECHEGNFGLRNILSAARANEAKQQKK